MRSVFQSTRPRGARLALSIDLFATAAVSIHAPTRGATVQGHARRPRRRFQSTRPRGARRVENPALQHLIKFQSTRPRGARPGRASCEGIAGDVSIHAPTRGATFVSSCMSVSMKVSIHAPTRGATISADHLGRLSAFQSTRPRGARLHSGSGLPRRARRFNPRAHAGRDERVAGDGAWTSLFQSTRPRGARPSDACALCVASAVSIHAPTRGATSAVHVRPDGPAVSIHAPTRGATRIAFGNKRAVMFQSTRPRGARHRLRRDFQAPDMCFNPRAHAGRDGLLRGEMMIGIEFQSTRPRGARRIHADEGPAGHGVSIHAPTRGATASSQRHEDNTKNTGSQRTLGVLQFEHAKMALRGIRIPREPSTFRGLRTCPCLAGH